MAGIDITGLRFGNLVAVRLDGRYANKAPRWLLRCDCGTVTHCTAGALRAGQAQRCASCRMTRVATHGMHGTRLYRVWGSIRARCERKSHPAFARYGGRGISICEEWLRFPAFAEWALGNGYADSLEIDRLDNDGNYEPSNCRFTTAVENMNNRSCSVKYSFFGEMLSSPQAARKFGHSASGITSRIQKGMTPEEAIETPWLK